MRQILGISLSFCILLACSSSESGGTAATGGSPSGGSGGSSASGGGGSGGSAATGGAAPACNAHAVSGEPAFTKRTSEWGLAGVTGNRIIAVDLDGDQYPDLVIHALSPNTRDPLTNGTPTLMHVLMNRPGPNGGRTFVDETVASGYGKPRDGATNELRSAQLAVAGDVDDDGDLDLWSGTYTDTSKVKAPPTPGDLDRSELLLNDGQGHFSLGDPLEPYASTALPTSGATFADVDRDGKIDLFVVGWYKSYGSSYVGTQARLHHGNGNGTFEEVTGDAGLLTDEIGFDEGTNHRPAYGTTSCDVNGDGAPDLLISAYGRQFNQLYLNDGSGKFTDVGRDSGYAGDDVVDYSDNQMFLCYCQNGGSDPKCAGAKTPVIACDNTGWGPDDSKPWRNNGNTFATACGDVNGDGVLDLYNAEIRHFWAGKSADGSALLLGTAGNTPKFSRPALDTAGLAWPHPSSDWNEGGLMSAIADLGNDGYADILVAASDYASQYLMVFHQKPDGTFEERGDAWGLHHPCASGLVVADFDRDGDLDVIVGSGTARDCGKIWASNEVHFYENDASTKGRSLELRLKGGPGSNRAAIGAGVTIDAGGTKIVREVGGGYGHFGMQNDLVVHAGVGDCVAANVEVRWPDQKLTTQALGTKPSNELVDIEQAP